MKRAKEQEVEVLNAYHAYWNSYLNGDMRTFASLLAENCHIIGSGACDVFATKQAVVDFYTATSGRISGKAEFRNRKIKLLPYQESVMVQELCDFYFLGDEEWSFYGHGRLSTLLNETETGWKIVHQHGSLPDSKAEKSEQVATGKITHKNRKLREAVKRLTIELEQKKRESQIELSLERVRARTMAMKQSDELLDAAMLLFQQVQALGVPPFVCGFNIWDEDKKAATAWMAREDSIEPRFKTSSAEDIYLPIYEAAQRGDSLFVREQGGDELDNHYKYLTSIPEVKAMGEEMAKAGLSWPSFQIMHCAFFLQGYLMFITYEPVPEAYDIFIRFANVFEQTYTRFLDLQKAEVQAREATIEVALERVRSRTMSMQHSDELAEVMSVLCKEILNLGIHPDEMETCYITTFDGNEPIGEIYLTYSYGDLLPRSFQIGYDEDPFFKQLFTEWSNGDSFFIDHLEGNRLIQHFDYLFSHVPDSIIEMRSSGPTQLPSETFTHALCFSQGYLAIVTRKAVPEYHEVFKRFGSALQQAYTRFLDLQKAEAQAREAQIEAALERVRSKAMAMQKSDDLANAVAIVFDELEKMTPGTIRCGISIINKEKHTTCIWSTIKTEEGTVLQVSGDESMDIHPLLKGAFKAWLQQEDYSYVLKGIDQQDFYTMLAQTNFRLPEDDLRHTEQFMYVAHVSVGGLYVFKGGEFSEDMKKVIKRFAAVFNLTYTRFNDLQIAEAHAIQAEQDLIQLKAAWKRAEEALTKLKTTQAQLIQSEKLATLGELTAGIAHEIQNPLNFVNNFSEVSTELVDELQEEQQKPDRDADLETEILGDLKQNLQKITHHGQRASSIVKGMLEHSRTATGERQPTDLNTLADEYLRLAYQGLRAKDKSFNADLKTDFSAELSQVEVIPQEIGRVLLNLYNNAFYAVQQKQKTALDDYQPTVWVSTHITPQPPEGGVVDLGGTAWGVEIRVHDNGTGIPNEVKAKIFQPFFTTKPTGQGTGLGLSLSYDIVTKGHGGTVQVESTAGEGSVFTITLPG